MPPDAADRKSHRRLRFTWVRARKTVQWLTLIIFILLFITSQRGGWAPDLVNIPMRLDPLLILANLLADVLYATLDPRIRLD